MKTVDLGTLEGEILVFGGPYSNLHATQALIGQAKERRIDSKNCICTGDMVAYCGHPAETVQAIRDFGCPVIAGNCEKQLAEGAADCGCGFDEGSTCDRLSADWFAYADRLIGAEDRVWMAGLPDVLTFEHMNRRFAVVHGGVSDVSRFLWPSSAVDDFQQEIDLIEDLVGAIDVVLAGHSGIPFVRDVGQKQWVNAGAIGMPPHDGRAETRFAVIENGVTFHRLAYEHNAEIAEMQRAGLTQGYHTALRSGIWPSQDVLPTELRR